MKFFIAALLLIPQLLLAAPVPGLIGRWKAENVLYGRGVEFRIGFNFAPQKTTIQVNCLFNMGARLSAQAASFTSYNANEILIHETHQTVADDGIHFCRATLIPARWTAYFDGTGRMVLFIPAPYQSQFNLVPVSTLDSSVLL